jgi:hypothetical protein
VEREIARVATACDLRAFRYIPFAAIKFDPFPIFAIAQESATPAANSAVESHELAQPTTPSPAFVADLVPLSVMPITASALVSPTALPVFATKPPAPPPSPQQRYRMLDDLALNQHPLLAPIPPPALEVVPKDTTLATRRLTIRPAMPAVRTAHPGSPPAASQVTVAPRGTPGSPRGTPRRAWPKTETADLTCP